MTESTTSGENRRGEVAAYCPVLRRHRVDYVHSRAEKGAGSVAHRTASRSNGHSARLAESFKKKWQRRGWAFLLIYIAFVVTVSLIVAWWPK
jgi:hypothetical protein